MLTGGMSTTTEDAEISDWALTSIGCATAGTEYTNLFLDGSESHLYMGVLADYTGANPSVAPIDVATFESLVWDWDYAENTVGLSSPVSGTTKIYAGTLDLEVDDLTVFGLDITADGTEEVISLVDVGSGTNNVSIANAADGSPPSIVTVGSSDANIDLKLAGKGTGKAKTYTELQIPVTAWTTDNAVLEGAFYFHVGKELAGMNMVYVHSEVITAGTQAVAELFTVGIYNLTQTAEILSTKLTIDTAETGSDDAAAAAVIDTDQDDMQENDLIRIDIATIFATTASKGLIVTMGFELP